MSRGRTAKHLQIEGRVQGVGFRAWLADIAHGEGVDGWVRNRRDGSVEAMVAGDDTAVARVVARCREGPPMSRVERLREQPGEDAVGPGFETRPTV